ncbi:hypothetical protein [Flaviflexus massiliensis]|uniref:hypothetical protein n=1 Tax=Flaviflexus massiliensis TaxID=1522309 RepID=UPI0006D53229|nr:hypothetical protein [Flaviflexus massiliensis]
MRSAISLLLLVCLSVLIPPAAASDSERPTVLIGTGGVMWEYVNEHDTPNLYALSNESAVGNVSVRGPHPSACPADGWLTLGAGERAGDGVKDGGRCRILEEPVNGEIPHWEEYEKAIETSPYSPTLGSLAELTEGSSTLTIGPGAALALADSAGTVENYGGLAELPDLLNEQDLVLIDIGAITEEDPITFTDTEPRPTTDPSSAAFTAPEWDEERIRERMVELDQQLGQVLETVEESMPDARILFVSLADYSGTVTTLQVIMERTGEPGLLSSSTTRRAGLVTATDLLPSLVSDAAGVVGPGSAITASPGGTYEDNRNAVTAFDSLTQAIKPATGWVFGMWGTAWILTLLATLLLRRNRIVHGAALAVASVPASAVLVNALPWHETGAPTLVLALGIALLGVVIGVVAERWGQRDRLMPALAVSIITLAAYLLPVLVGSPLALNSVFGALPAVGRFYGMNNMMFAIVTASGLVLAGIIAERVRPRHRAALLILALGAIIILIDGSPWHGTDFGGPPVLTVVFGMMAWLVSGRKLTWLSSLGMVLAGVVVAGMSLLVDYLRPVEERTHLGDFAESLLSGEGFDVVWRKGMAVLNQWPLILLLLVVFGAIAYLWWKRGPKLPTISGNRPWLWTTLAISVALLGGMVLNDSGVIIVIVGGMVAIPLLASVLYYRSLPSGDTAARKAEHTELVGKTD